MLYPAQFIHANTLAPDIFLQTCTVLYFHQFVMLIKKGEWKYALYMSITLVLGFLVKPVLYPFSWVHCIILLAVATRFKLGLLRFSLVSVIPIIVLMLYMSWNHSRTGKTHFSSTQSFNAIYYYYFYFADKNGVDEARAFLQHERQTLDSIPVFNDRYDYANEKGVSLLKANFVPYMSYHLMHSARLLVNPGKGEMDLFIGRETLGGLYTIPNESFATAINKHGVTGLNQYIAANPTLAFAMVVAIFNFFRLIGLSIFLFHRKINIWIRLFTAGFVCYFIIMAGPIENTRYFIPVSLIAIGGATLSFQHVLKRYRNKSIIVNN
jgi:hypothetical protein